MEDEVPPKLKKLVEEQSHKPSAVTVAGHVGGDGSTEETKVIWKKPSERTIRGGHVRICISNHVVQLDIYTYICQLFLSEVGKKEKSW